MPPRNLDLLELIRARRERDWKPSVEELKKGFRGWHQRGYLPHFDTLIRDEAHLKRAIRYTEQNPVKAFLAKAAREWPSCSARHRDEFERLPWQRGE